MPYIPQDRREVLNPYTGHAALTEGELNYQISALFNIYLVSNGVNYGNMGDCTAAGENAVAEFRRRVMAPYEDLKIIQNGDVYGGTFRLMVGHPDCQLPPELP